MDRSRLKRPLPLSDDTTKPPPEKRARFPKGKKVKPGDEPIIPKDPVTIGAEKAPADPKLAAKERAERRKQMTAELFGRGSRGISNDISAAEVHYEDNTDFVEDGIQIEPFNLKQEMEEGYFDADGNFVEYVQNGNEIKDAWLDSVSAVFTEKSSIITEVEEDGGDLSSGDIGKIKRRIADLLEPGETVLHALRRLKGTTNDKKDKMPEKTKQMFDQLTDDSMKLMDSGDYNVYHDKQEDFEREAEGYERLARAKEGISGNVNNGSFDLNTGVDIFSDCVEYDVASSSFSGAGLGSSDPNISTPQIASGNDVDSLDIFAENDENPTVSYDHNVSGSGSVPEQPSSENLYAGSEGADAQTDYVYDESSGYYYSGSSGYYYDPASGMYCSASSGKWYSFNEQTSTYDELHGEAEYPVSL